MAASSIGQPESRYRAGLVSAAAVLTAAIWLSTGTMAPYAATAEYPRILEPCHYLVNVDHDHFTAVTAMIAGEPSGRWGGSVVLRRILFPIVAHPFIQLMGFMAGGLVASILLHLAAFLAFAAFVRRRSGDRAALTAAWLLATYPGVTYWAGLPYSYVVIVPGSLFGLILLDRLHQAADIRQVIRAAFLLGLIFIGYDLAPFFGLAALLVLAVRRRIAWTGAAALAMAVPTLLVFAMLMSIRLPILNSNTAGYLTVLTAYLRPNQPHLWARYLFELPLVFLSNFVFGNLIFLPLLFAAALLVGWRLHIPLLSLPEKALLVSGLALFLFTNAAPPYEGWQMRGQWMARLYQPLFAVFLVVIARVTAQLSGALLRRWAAAVVLAIAANASVAFGPVLMNPLAGYAYHKFYVHSPAESLLVNLERFGRRPLGVCSGSHAWDGVPNPNTPFNRPGYMYRYPDGPRRGAN